VANTNRASKAASRISKLANSSPKKVVRINRAKKTNRTATVSVALRRIFF